MLERKDERQPQRRVPEGALGVGFPQHKHAPDNEVADSVKDSEE